MTTPAPTTADPVLDARKARAKDAFEALRDRICTAFEALEDAAPPALYPGAAGRFERTPWTREGGGGGVMGVMRGRLFEKVGVHVSTVHGTLPPQMAANLPGADADPRFFATGVSLIAHMWSPHVPAVHMNTRFIATTRGWFGGGADLTPLLARDRRQDTADAAAFHAAMKAACDAHDPGPDEGSDGGPAPSWYERFKAWCDDYFHLPHRDEPRGIGGVFYDHHDSGDWERDFAFTKAVGEAFLAVYPDIVRRRMAEPWNAEDREAQLVQRGRYVEFNLLYDRGTTFGLKTGGNVASILSSLPPLVRWP